MPLIIPYAKFNLKLRNYSILTVFENYSFLAMYNSIPPIYCFAIAKYIVVVMVTKTLFGQGVSKLLISWFHQAYKKIVRRLRGLVSCSTIIRAVGVDFGKVVLLHIQNAIA